MQASVAHLDANRWPDATALGRELRVLADIAVGAFIQDVRDLVRTQIRAVIFPILEDKTAEGYPAAFSRRVALKKWLDVEHPLDWGDEATTHVLLVQAVTQGPIEAARGLPSSDRGQQSVEDLVNHFFHVGTTTGFAALRPPIWNKGQCWPILRAAVVESRRRALRTLDAAAADVAVKEALISIVEERHIRFYPDSLPPSGDNTRRSLQPSFEAWSRIGPQARQAVVPGLSAPMTQQERLDFEMSQNSLTEMRSDPSSTWDTRRVIIADYHEHLDHTVLPKSWNITAEMINQDSDPFIIDCYEWAKSMFLLKRSDWKCDLALHLAFLISKVTPHVAWPATSKALEAPLRALGIDKARSVVPRNTRRAAITVIRTLEWTERDVKGVKQEEIYYTQASIVFLCWIHEASPLRRCLQKKDGPGLGAAWGTKHRKLCLPPR